MLINILDISIKVSQSINSHNEVILLQWEHFQNFEQKAKENQLSLQVIGKPSIPQLIDCYLPQINEQVLTLVRNALNLAPSLSQLAAIFSDLPTVLLNKLFCFNDQPKYFELIVESLIKLICDLKIELNNKASLLDKAKQLHCLLNRLANFKYVHLMKMCVIFDSLDCGKYKYPGFVAFNVIQQYQEINF
eukprot:TRINITY_DN7273_c0_g1_i2.p1 TRINITY_DN7273_c0_g1~~TRINITY_DN7273_c0_g1_i2.p1  ORF type:complete len:190 (+),score=29.76 TRINITY_DN7273_c0_g1_i2:446-1015(+)